MGGRGSYSYSGKRSAKDGSTLSAYAVASLNKGTAGGTTVESAIARFREQLMDNRYEHSAYIDDAGYVHALGFVLLFGLMIIVTFNDVVRLFRG